ncbi:Bug family tripartite tricarboxylate transporter substrate binding protein [Ramlibacter solisilvae]|uniref:Twin-arginine translocation pathway signal n=1 Tax=Ramlibacter tataouinensis TaxID=94132 RepID=A0A127JTG5_9BURK|nr:Bug family tripartite tricarboxylate transporter substrate binding protein [Ramlibacter tataouinensis]AMO23257.1 Twin-arginine translocation pathway signal [Ramlibacter tataouinensis]
MKLTRRTFALQTLAGAAALTGLPALAQARTIRLLVGFPPGGGTDAVARLLGEHLKDALNATVVVDNKPGAGGQLAAQALKAAAPDGNTLFLSHDHTISILPQVTKNPGFEPAQDFVPVAGFATFVNAFAVSGGTPAKSFNDYVKWIQEGNDKTGGNATKGRGTVGVPAPASTPEFLVKLIGEKYKLDLAPAPYRGSAPMMADMLGNQIAAGVGSVPDFMENHRAGKLHIVGVLGKERQATLPDVPTFHELGLTGFEDVPYYGVFAPKGVSPAFVSEFGAAMSKVLAMPAVREQMQRMGLAPEYMTAQKLGERERAYTATWAKIIKAKGFAPAQ